MTTTEPPHAGLARRIKERRESLGMTNAQLAQATSRSEESLSVYLSNMETGYRRQKPTGAFVAQMALALGVRSDWLLTGEGPMVEQEDLPPDPDHPERRAASVAALLLGYPREVIEEIRAHQPSRKLDRKEWFRLIDHKAAVRDLG